MIHLGRSAVRTACTRTFSTAYSGSVLVVGSTGQLGRAVMEKFSGAGWSTLGFDAHVDDDECSGAHLRDTRQIPAAGQACHVQLPSTDSLLDNATFASALVGDLDGLDKLDAVVITAGGWAGGGVGDEDALRSIDVMWHACVQSASLGAHLAARFLRPGGLLLMTGAAAALPAAGDGGGSGGTGTVGMAGYGMAKAATHHLVRNLAASDELGEGSCVAALCPATIDTPSNRAGMPDADFSTWTPMGHMADKAFEWSSDEASRPASGALVTTVTQNGSTDFIVH